jgi:hypothetical protein
MYFHSILFLLGFILVNIGIYLIHLEIGIIISGVFSIIIGFILYKEKGADK